MDSKDGHVKVRQAVGLLLSAKVRRDGSLRCGVLRTLVEALEFFHERRALEIQQLRRLPFVSAGAFQRSLNQLALDVGDERVQVHAFFRRSEEHTSELQ